MTDKSVVVVASAMATGCQTLHIEIGVPLYLQLNFNRRLPSIPKVEE